MHLSLVWLCADVKGMKTKEKLASNMRVRYVGESFGIDSLTNGKEYEVISYDEASGALRIVDDSEEDYLYDPHNPRPIAKPDHPGGKFEIVEDDENGTLLKTITEKAYAD